MFTYIIHDLSYLAELRNPVKGKTEPVLDCETEQQDGKRIDTQVLQQRRLHCDLVEVERRLDIGYDSLELVKYFLSCHNLINSDFVVLSLHRCA